MAVLLWSSIGINIIIFFSKEHHLQRAISAQQVYGDTQQLVIPTPESEEMKAVPSLVRNNFKQPKQYIHVQGELVDHLCLTK